MDSKLQLNAGAESARADSLKRIVSRADLKPVPDGTYIQVLPGGKVLFNPTPLEYAIIELYAAEIRRLDPGIEVICSANEKGQR